MLSREENSRGGESRLRRRSVSKGVKMTTTFETSPPQTVEEAREYLRKVSFGDAMDLELAADNFALAIDPLCCVVDVAYGGESHPEDAWRDVCDRFEKESEKLLAVISTWIEYSAACDLVGGVTEARRIHAEVYDTKLKGGSSQSNGGAR